MMPDRFVSGQRHCAQGTLQRSFKTRSEMPTHQRIPDPPTAYERQQLARITAWRQESPDFFAQAFGRALSPAAQAVQRAIPVDWLRSALNGVQRTSARMADQRSVLRAAKVDDLADLRDGDLEDCDKVAVSVGRRGAALAGGSGALFGVIERAVAGHLLLHAGALPLDERVDDDGRDRRQDDGRQDAGDDEPPARPVPGAEWLSADEVREDRGGGQAHLEPETVRDELR